MLDSLSKTMDAAKKVSFQADADLKKADEALQRAKEAHAAIDLAGVEAAFQANPTDANADALEAARKKASRAALFIEREQKERDKAQARCAEADRKVLHAETELLAYQNSPQAVAAAMAPAAEQLAMHLRGLAETLATARNVARAANEAGTRAAQNATETGQRPNIIEFQGERALVSAMADHLGIERREIDPLFRAYRDDLETVAHYLLRYQP